MVKSRADCIRGAVTLFLVCNHVRIWSFAFFTRLRNNAAKLTLLQTCAQGMNTETEEKRKRAAIAREQRFEP